MYGKKSESLSDIVSECEKSTKKEYKRRHDVLRIFHWKLCGKYNLEKVKSGINMFQKVLLKMEK